MFLCIYIYIYIYMCVCVCVFASPPLPTPVLFATCPTGLRSCWVHWSRQKQVISGSGFGSTFIQLELSKSKDSAEEA